jgi:hypothetical protein
MVPAGPKHDQRHAQAEQDDSGTVIVQAKPFFNRKGTAEQRRDYKDRQH